MHEVLPPLRRLGREAAVLIIVAPDGLPSGSTLNNCTSLVDNQESGPQQYRLDSQAPVPFAVTPTEPSCGSPVCPRLHQLKCYVAVMATAVPTVSFVVLLTTAVPAGASSGSMGHSHTSDC